jgi:6-phosphogluconolactonase
MGERRVLADSALVALAAADRVATLAGEALAARDFFRLGLSGGRTPEAAYRLLASPEFRGRMPWTRIQVFFADERDAPPTEPESNYWLIRKLLVEPVGIPPENVHRMKADSLDLDAAARAYQPLLGEPLDLLLLGVGEDGHTASLFPGSPLLRERERMAAAVYDSPKPPPRRLTITPPAIAATRNVIVLVTGASKAVAVARALEQDGAVEDCPARLLRGYDWLLDVAAAAELTSPV